MIPRGAQWTVLLLVVAAAASQPAGVAAAQSAGADSAAQLVGATISITVDDAARVDAVYRFQRGADGSSAWLNGTMWIFEDISVRGLDVAVDGTAVDPTGRTGDRHRTVSVPVDGTDDTTTVRLRYTVPVTGALTVPLWVPEQPTSGTEEAVSIRVTLPPESTLTRARFPAVEELTADGRRVEYRLSQVPGFVALTYGPDRRANRLRTFPGAGVTVAIVGLWVLILRWDRGGDR